MVNRILQPQEIEVFYILPAIRRELAHCLKAKGKSQKDIAALLGVTGAAVSQYISAKRGSEIQFNEKLKAAFADSAGKIACGQTMTRETQKLLQLARSERMICQMHASLGKVPVGCNLCFE
ncbi:transcriptional regulator [Candidatus Woesearchaeota archaeon]|nr:MAG: transcriptional regulator [Candidatus Woesearchaeota archaeon]